MMQRSSLHIVWIVGLAGLIYLPYLGHAPIYLGQDEVFFAVSAHSIASTAHDINGRFMPLYFEWPGRSPAVWFQPIPVYLTALFLRALPVSEWAIRLPTVVLGLTDIALIYFIAARIFKRERSAIVAAVLLMLTPAHLIHSRLAMDFLYPLVFVMAWLLCLLIFLERRQLRTLFAATTFLGIGFYSYIASVAMMPIYFFITCLTLLKAQDKPGRSLLVAAMGFAWPLLILMPWLSGHLAAIADTSRRYGLDAVVAQGRVQGVTSLKFLAAMTERISLYWRYFDPAYLFVAGGGYTVNTTHRVGVFLLPLAVCLAIGLNEIVNGRRTLVNMVLLIGFLTAPLAACLVAEAYAIQRELVLLPFVVLIATFGVEYLMSARPGRLRVAAWCVLAFIPVQFCIFYADYFTTYQTRSAFGFGGNIRGALEDIIDRERSGDVRPVYLSTDVQFVDLYWRLYLTKYGREDLLSRTVYFDSGRLDVRSVPSRSLVLARADGSADELTRSGKLRTVRLINSIDQTACCVILETISVGKESS
jgi:4-amino-4-deoxy-L-arabinose transferase-like glycosyltransferase